MYASSSNVWKSRKLWIMIVDIVFSTIIYFVGQYASPQIAEDVKWVILSWQPAVFAVINGIATEDAANVTASATLKVADIEKVDAG